MGQDKWARKRSLGELQNQAFDHTYRLFKIVPYGYTGSAYSALPAAPTTPTVYNVSMTNADTEYSQALPANTKKVDIKLRSLNAQLKVCFTSGESGTTYITLPYGASLHLEGVNLTTKTLYFQSSKAAQTCEIAAWV